MTNHLNTLLKALTVPSERIELENKKNIDLFFKNFKKKKRSIFTKLIKNQIHLSQIITFHENLIRLLSNKKKTRLENVINQTNIYFEFQSPSFLINDNNAAGSSSILPKKRVLEEHMDAVTKKPKLMAIHEEIKDKHLSKVISKADDKYTDNCLNDGNSANIVRDSAEAIANETYSIDEKAIVTVMEDDVIMRNAPVCVSNNEKRVISAKVQPKPTVSATVGAIRGRSNAVRRAPIATNVTAGSKATTLPRHLDKSASLRTPQAALYKSKYHQDFSRSQGLVKSTTKPLSQTHGISNKAAATTTAVCKKAQNTELKQRGAATATLTKISSLQNRPLVMPRVAPQKAITKAANAPIALNTHRTGLLKTTISTTSRQPFGNSNVINAKVFPQKSGVKSITKKALSFNKLPTTTTILSTKNESSTTLRTLLTAAVVAAPPQPTNDSFMSAITVANSDRAILHPTMFKTPFSKKRQTMLTHSCLRIVETHDSYDISDLVDVGSDEEDEDEDNDEEREQRLRRRRVPDWCNKSCGTLSKLIQFQSKHCSVADTFRNPSMIPINIRQIFGNQVVVMEGALEDWIVA